MADLLERLPENAPGRFYVDSNCIDCDICRGDVPAFFRRNDDIGLSVVFHQPATEQDIRLCLDAIEACPVEAIGDLESS